MCVSHTALEVPQWQQPRDTWKGTIPFCKSCKTIFARHPWNNVFILTDIQTKNAWGCGAGGPYDSYIPLLLCLCFFFLFSFFPSFRTGETSQGDCSCTAFNLQQVHVKWCCVGEGFAWLKWEVAVKANKLCIHYKTALNQLRNISSCDDFFHYL